MTKSDTGSELVFVYGTLRREASNAFRMEGAEFVGRGRVAGRLYRVDWYPGMVAGGDGWVVGEAFRVGVEQMRALDEFEGIPEGEMEGNEYRKVEAVMALEGMPWEETPVRVYEWKGEVDEANRISSGDWLDFERPRGRPVLTIAGICVAAMAVVATPLMGTLFRELAPLSRRLGGSLSEITTGFLTAFASLALILAEKRREPGENARWVGWLCVSVVALLWAAQIMEHIIG